MKQRLPIAVSAVAVVAALLGSTSVGNSARNLLIPRGSVGTLQLKNNAVTSTKVKNFSLRAIDFKPGQLPKGAQGPAGPAGPAGAQGPQGPQGPSGVSGLERVYATGTASSTGTRTLTAVCPAGKQALGGGASIVPVNAPGVAITANYLANNATWTASAREVNPTGTNWSLNTVVICASVPQ